MSEADHKYERRIIDVEHLKLLAIFHYVSGGMAVLFSSLFFFYAGAMTLIPAEVLDTPRQPIPGVDAQLALSVITWLFGTLGALGIIYGILQIISGRLMMKRRRRLFSLIVAIPNVIFIPYGTILSVLTIIVLDRNSVKELYLERAGTTDQPKP